MLIMQALKYFYHFTSENSDEFTYGAYNSSPPPHDWFSPLDDDSQDSDDHILYAKAGLSSAEE